MGKKLWLLLLAASVTAWHPGSLCAENPADAAKKAVGKSTLDQPGTKPFHLKAEYAPGSDRDKDSNRNGEIEIWWKSPTQWRREVRSPEFHQIAVVDGTHQWQKNDGDYFPDWLRELAVAIVQPVPLPTDVLLERLKSAQVRDLRMPARMNGQVQSIEQTNFDWEPTGKPGDAQSNGKGNLALLNGLVSYSNGPGWSGGYHDFRDFHGRMVARTVSSGYVGVTAKIDVLEDLGPVPQDFFDASAPGGNAAIETVVLNEAELRENLQPESKPFAWPPLADGPLEGVVWTDVVIDRTGRIREMTPPIADNAGVKDAAEEGFRAMQFRPVLRDGVPVQAWAKLSVTFKTTRPAGMETFDSARNYFERGRRMSFLAAGANAPYVLRAEFEAGTPDGVKTGRYEDTWVSATEWKREAWFGSSHLVKSQNGEQHYVLSEGSDAAFLRNVMMILEPIPAGDTMTESDWRIRRDTVSGLKAIRVFRGPEGPNGELEPGKSQGFWFSESGQLVKVYTGGLEIQPADVESYGGVDVARRIDVVQNGKLGMRIVIKEIGTVQPGASSSFELKGHEWKRAFTAEVR